MNLHLDILMQEILEIELSEIGLTAEQIDKCIDSIKYNVRETNSLHNSVADSNYYAAEKRKEDERIASLKKEIEDNKKRFDKKLEEQEREARYRIRKLQDEIERLNKP